MLWSVFYYRIFWLVDGPRFEGIDHDDTQIVEAQVPSTVPTKPEDKAGPAAVRYWPLHVLPALVGSSWAEKQHFNACCGAIWKWQRGGFWMWLLHAFVRKEAVADMSGFKSKQVEEGQAEIETFCQASLKNKSPGFMFCAIFHTSKSFQ